MLAGTVSAGLCGRVGQERKGREMSSNKIQAILHAIFAACALVLSGCGGGSDSTSSTSTSGASAAPIGVSAAAASTSEIDINWTTDVSATSYHVYRSGSSGVSITPANEIGVITVPPTRIPAWVLPPNTITR